MGGWRCAPARWTRRAPFSSRRSSAAARPASSWRASSKTSAFSRTSEASWSEAVRHYERAVESYRATNDEHGSATAYVNLGIAHTDLRQFDWADSYFSKSFDIAERAGDVYLRDVPGESCEAHFMRGRYDEARRNAEAALAIFGPARFARRQIGSLTRSSGWCTANRPARAGESRLRSAIELAVSAGSVLNEAEAARELALLMQGMGRNQDALTL